MDAKDAVFNALYKDDLIEAKKILFAENLHGDLRDTNVRGDGATVLGVAVRLGDLDFAKTLIARGAKIDAIGAGVQAIHLASTPACVQLLVEHGANVNAQTEEGPLLPTGTTPLMNAIMNSNVAVFNELMALDDTDVTLENAAGRDAISLASGHAIPEMYQAVIARKVGRPDILVPLSAEESNTIRPVATAEQTPVEQAGPVVDAVQSGQEQGEEANKGEENTIRPVEVAGASQAVQADAIRPVGIHANAGAASQEQGADTAVQQPILNTLLRGRFVRDEAGIYRRQGEQREALADEGAQIRFIDKQMDTFEAGVELAKAKGWKAIEATGTEKFRSEAWFHAKAAGLDVVGYEPNEADLKRLEVYSQKGIDKAGDKSINVSPIALNADQSEHLKALAESKAVAEQFAFGEKMGVQGINPNRGRYSGKVLHETEHHIVQEIGRGTAVVHSRDDLDAGYKELLKSCKSVRIHYDQGKGKAQAAEKERRFGLGR
jgi:hypothetical protein